MSGIALRLGCPREASIIMNILEPYIKPNDEVADTIINNEEECCLAISYDKRYLYGSCDWHLNEGQKYWKLIDIRNKINESMETLKTEAPWIFE